MLYISKEVSDQLSDDICQKLSKLSIERQTLFECFYYRFSDETRDKKVILYALLEGVQECEFVK